MDHLLEDDGEFGTDLDLPFWGQAFPEVSGID